MPVTDYHAYFQPPRFLDCLRKRRQYPRIERTGEGEAIFTGPGTGRPIRPEQIDLDRRIELMDESGVDVQILRLQNVGGIDAFELHEACEMARLVNEELADIQKRHAGRFKAYACVPMQSAHKAAEEVRHAVVQLGHHGVGVSCQLDGKGLDDAQYLPFLKAVQALDVPLLVLPNHPPLLAPALQPYGWLAGAFGFQVDLTWAVLRLLASGVMDEEVPRLRVVVANLGGVLASIPERLDEYWRRVHVGSPSLKQLPSQALRRFYYETASAHPEAIATAARLFGCERLLFGSDYPSFSLRRGIENVRRSGLAPADIQKILAGNSDALLAPGGPMASVAPVT